MDGSALRQGGNIYDRINDIGREILEQMSQGVGPWVRPWRISESGRCGLPYNLVTGREYQGVNILSLWATQLRRGYMSAGWITLNQMKTLNVECGGGRGWADAVVRLKKINDMGEQGTGQHPAIVIKVVETQRRDAAPEDDETIRVPRVYHVYNLDQIEGVPDWLKREKPALPPQERNAEIQRLVEMSKARITYLGDEAYYHPVNDSVVLPPPEAFDTEDDFQATRFHELVHWTGAKHRLARPSAIGKTAEGSWSATYAFEELVAEVGAAFLCAVYGVQGNLQHAEYLSTYYAVLGKDPKAFWRAATAASKAAQFLRGPIEAEAQAA